MAKKDLKDKIPYSSELLKICLTHSKEYSLELERRYGSKKRRVSSLIRLNTIQAKKYEEADLKF